MVWICIISWIIELIFLMALYSTKGESKIGCTTMIISCLSTLLSLKFVGGLCIIPLSGVFLARLMMLDWDIFNDDD